MGSKINFVSVVHWIRQGVAKQVPNKIELTKDDLKRIIDEHKQLMPTDDEQNEEQMSLSEDSDEENNGNEEDDEKRIVDKYDLENYDEDSEGELGANSLNALASLTMFADNTEDPYIDNEVEYSDDGEAENFEIKSTDNLVLVGHVESDAPVLEVYVYNEVDDHYPHHDIILPSYPICFESINYSSSSEQPVNYIGIGDMSKDITIWDIDTVNSLEPVTKLCGHNDTVLDLSWNVNIKKILASVSVDHSCCIWDLEKSELLTQYKHFKSNVQSVEFHPFEAQTLLVGDCNGMVSIGDFQSGAFKKWKVGICEIEKVLWNHYNPYTFFCSTSNGFVYNYDVRNEKKHIYSIKAHEDSVTGLTLSRKCNGCLITGSTDKIVKVWDIDDKSAKFITQFSDLNVGSVLSISANPDLPFIIAVGGDNNKSENFKIIDISKSKKVSSHFVSRMNKSSDK
ncbi:periodic tryptophan protein 1 homolog [Oppia nitens]|uniref:periodic tryptophan protein 1 homolog n=1 Tax=Oppia nitens TaxID=1686743 RepID=UPI0023DA2021|nr:periodic tryptophan protein 1 homolog [Oppia nitens]